MKKMLVVVAVVGMAFAACGKKKAPAAPKPDTGSATMPAGSDAGSGAPAGDGSAAPAAGG